MCPECVPGVSLRVSPGRFAVCPKCVPHVSRCFLLFELCTWPCVPMCPAVFGGCVLDVSRMCPVTCVWASFFPLYVGILDVS